MMDLAVGICDNIVDVEDGGGVAGGRAGIFIINRNKNTNVFHIRPGNVVIIYHNILINMLVMLNWLLK